MYSTQGRTAHHKVANNNGTGTNMSEHNTMKALGQQFKSALYIMLLGVLVPSLAWGQAALLPNAKQQYLNDAGQPVAGGQVFYYIPPGTTKKTVWQDAGETTAAPNPVQLDAAGRPVPTGQTFGAGTYRQKVLDVNGITIWDAVTASTGSSGGSAGQVALGDNAYVGDIHAYAGLVAPTNYMFAAGQPILRATYASLMSAITLAISITCSSGSPTISGLTDTSQINTGPMEASCFPAGTFVIAKTSSSVTLNNNATASIVTTGTFFPWGNGDGSVTFNLPNLTGLAVVGRDNLNGTSAGILTAAFCGQNPDSLAARCGSQSTTLVPANLPAYTPAGTITNGAITNGAITAGAITNGAITAGAITNGAITINSSTGAVIASTGAANVGGGGSFSFAPTTLTAPQAASSQANPTQAASSQANPTQAASSQAASTFAGTPTSGTSVAFSRVIPSVTINYVIKVQADTISSGLIGVSANLPLSVITTNAISTISLGLDPLYFGINGSGQLTMSPALGGMAYQSPGAVAITGGTITGMPPPVNPTDVATKSYADGIAAGIVVLAASDYATAAALPNTPTYSNGAAGVGATLTAGSNTTLTVDGAVVSANSAVLVKNQASAFQNGIFTLTTAGGGVPWVLTRATYFNTAAQMKSGSYTLIKSGVTLAGNAYVLQNTVTTVGTDPLNFTLFSQPFANIVNVQARQSILSSVVDAAGSSNFAVPGTGLNVNLSATVSPLTMAFAAGFNPTAGAIDFVGQLSSDAASYWAALPANQYSFISIDRNAVTGILSATQTLMRPQRGPIFYAPRQALLHFENNLTDDWGNLWFSIGATFTAPCAKFGSLGLSLSGSASFAQTSQIFNPGLGNWTMDTWTNLVSNVNSAIMSEGNVYGVFVNTNASGKLLLFISSGGVSWDISSGAVAGATTVTAGTYHHFALVFNGVSYVLYLDGVAQIIVSSSTVVWPDGAAMVVGNQAGGGQPTAGCWDEFDFVPFARWVANFTPPVAAYTVSGDWFNTNKMVMNTASGAGPTWTTVQRQYVAEATTGASTVTAVYDYSAPHQSPGSDFSIDGVGKLRVGNHVIYAEGTPQFITGSTPGTPCTTVPACTIGSPVTWVFTPSQVPPDAKWFDVQINVFHAAIGGTNPGNQDCTLQSRIPIGTVQGFIALGAAYSNFTGFGTVTNTSAFSETAGTVARFPVINGVAAFETTIGGGTCTAGGTNNQARIVTGILLGYDMP